MKEPIFVIHLCSLIRRPYFAVPWQFHSSSPKAGLDPPVLTTPPAQLGRSRHELAKQGRRARWFQKSTSSLSRSRSRGVRSEVRKSGCPCHSRWTFHTTPTYASWERNKDNPKPKHMVRPGSASVYTVYTVSWSSVVSVFFW